MEKYPRLLPSARGQMVQREESAGTKGCVEPQLLNLVKARSMTPRPSNLQRIGTKPRRDGEERKVFQNIF
jgi:hypothetical protein